MSGCLAPKFWGLLDHSTFFDLLGLPQPIGEEAILEALLDDLVIQHCDAGGWNITNLGAVLLARNLPAVRRLARKSLRIVQYRGTSRLSALREIEGTQGYASGFDGLINRVMDLLPCREDIVGGLRKMTPAFPELAVRELLANALIHQDFHVTGAGPMLEIFDDRVEITNPGEPLVATERFLDTSPKSRNEGLASLMRRFGICEERGTGIDKVVNEIESRHRPAAVVRGSATKHADGTVRIQGRAQNRYCREDPSRLPARLPALRES